LPRCSSAAASNAEFCLAPYEAIGLNSGTATLQKNNKMQQNAALSCFAIDTHEKLVPSINVVFSLDAILDHNTRRGAQNPHVFNAIPWHTTNHCDTLPTQHIV